MTETKDTFESRLDVLMPGVMDGLAQCWRCPVGANTETGMNLPGQRAVWDVLNSLISLLFPGCHGQGPVIEMEMRGAFQEKLLSTASALRTQVHRAMRYQCEVGDCGDCDTVCARAEEAVEDLIEAMPRIQQTLQEDIAAAYDGDPAARSSMEIVMSYPGVYAIIVHRIAHLLYQHGAPLIPRIMAEHAHSRTGIDIHPGAQIGSGFFIDHGTGVVIGETSVIGRNVKLYQGVTLGAMSFEKDDRGRLVKGVKRHPEVQDHVVIYAQATILGGSTVIGARSEIGGNVWLTHSVPPGSKVYNQQPRPLIRQVGGAWKPSDGPWPDTGFGI